MSCGDVASPQYSNTLNAQERSLDKGLSAGPIRMETLALLEDCNQLILQSSQDGSWLLVGKDANGNCRPNLGNQRILLPWQAGS